MLGPGRLFLADIPQYIRTGRLLYGTETYPSFVHKWSRERRGYTRGELQLPDTVQAWGNKAVLQRPRIGVGGTRSPAVETFQLVTAVCDTLSLQGLCTISGGVPGVDLACHLSGASGNGGTIAVLANPVDRRMAANGWHNAALDALILRSGLFVSEYDDYCPVGTAEFGERLLQRDRIISGLSDVFVAFECNVDSATVDTAWRALCQGAAVVTVHPPVMRERRGTLQLAEHPRVLSLDARTESVAEIVAGIVDTLAIRAS